MTNAELVRQYAQLHATKRYGAECHKSFLLHVQACIADVKPKIVVEYGCGQSLLYKTLDLNGIEFHRYDPAIPGISELTVNHADFVINTDVMEHIPGSDVDKVLENLRNISGNIFFNISTRPARQILPNGENAHCTVWPAEKWISEIRRFFPDAQLVNGYTKQSCMIITWKSTIGGLLEGVERYRQLERTLNAPPKVPAHIFKRAERCIRKSVKKIWT